MVTTTTIAGVLSLALTISSHPPSGGGGVPAAHDHMPRSEVQRIEQLLERSAAELQAAGKLKVTPNAPKIDNLQWPLRARPGYSAPEYSGVSNFVDLNAAVPNQLLDFSCGARTYDLSNGYNHAGIDYFLWPFEWQLMDAGLIEIVAAAPGTIIAKEDGSADRSCPNNYSANWNAVYVQHSDATVAWYGHMKLNSLTAKPAGATVAAGEYLGLVGSSGFSSGPHLHFELRSNAQGNAQILEAHAGACRSGPSMWANQRPYFDSRVSRLATHSAPPNFNVPCPNPTQETPNFKDRFNPGEQGLFAAYYRDQRRGQLTQYRITRPDGSVYQSWQHAPNNPQTAFYAASYWYWIYNLPQSPAGTWNFEATFEGRTERKSFLLGPDVIFANAFQ